MSEDEQQADEEDERAESDMRIVRSHVTQLAEHFDTIQVFCTRHMETELGGTIVLHLGSGNWFARYGGVREWVIKQEESMRITERNED